MPGIRDRVAGQRARIDFSAQDGHIRLCLQRKHDRVVLTDLLPQRQQRSMQQYSIFAPRDQSVSNRSTLAG
jgi:hypothetical protein